MFAKILISTVLAAGTVLATVGAAAAGGPQGIAVPQIAVPSPIAIPVPTPSYAGGWHITQNMYGPYQINFNLSQYGGGSYQVTGGGIYCNGGLNWSNNGYGSINVQLHYSSCGNGVDWTADRMSCSWANYGAPYQWIRCNYQPAVYGYQPVSVLAQRTY